MSFQRLVFFLKEAFISCMQNRAMTIASISTATVALFVLGASFLFFAQMQGMIQEIQGQVEVGIFLEKNADRTDAEVLRMKILSISGVDKAELVDRKKAFKNLLNELGSRIKLLQVVDKNPLPHAIKVRARDPVVLERVAREAEKMELVEEVVYPQKIVRRLNSVFAVGKVSAVATISFLIFASVILIVNAIRLSVFARRKEIRIMQLVGATNWFIRMPFMIEGLIQGFIGAFFACVVLFILYRFGLRHLPEALPFLFSPLPAAILKTTSAGMLLGGTVIGMLGSLLATGTHLEEV